MKPLHQPAVSVIIPVFNAEIYLKETIDSVLCQTFKDFEILLLDDGSTDRSPQIIQSYSDSRIKYIPCSHDFIKTLNHGLSTAQGKYIALLDHDDLMVPKRIQIQYDFMEQNPEIIACGGNMYSFGKYSKLMEAPSDYSEIMKRMIICSPMYNPTGFIRTDILNIKKIRYQEGYSFAADFKFWSDLVKVGKVVNIPEVLTIYRTSDTQTSIIFAHESSKGANLIYHEMTKYFLSMIRKDNEFFSILENQIVPGMVNLSKHSFFSARTYFLFMYELICGLIEKGAIQIKSGNNTLPIKVGYLVSYDYQYIKHSLPTIYEYADQIFLAIDKDRKTWSGSPIQIPDTFFEWIIHFDTSKKIQIYEDQFYIQNLAPSECETRERNLLAKKMGNDGWYIQLDVDEYFLDFKKFVNYLHSIDNSLPTCVYAQWITIFKQIGKDFFYIDSNEEFPVATNNPQYSFARYPQKCIVRKTKYKLLHHSWGRSENELNKKLSNWGHSKDFDIDAYFNFWQSINKDTYKYVRNFHPLSPNVWKQLQYAEAENIKTLIEIVK